MRARDLDPDYVERAEKGAFFDGMNPGEVTRFEARQKSKDGRVFPVDVRLSKVSFGGETFIQALCTDITERKQAERERDKLREQLSQAQKMESVGRLAGGVAHDFNNMLFVILGHAEFAISELPTGSALHQQLQAIHKAASHSAELTSQLLAFARKQPVTRKILDVNETVSSTLKLLKRLIGEGICLEWRPGEDIGPVHVDPAQIEQVLTNLVVNARDAIGSAGKIVIETRQVGLEPEPLGPGEGANPAHYVEIAVSDNGSGMDEATQKKIFDPFFTTKEVGKGTGLGLATIYGIITQNKGFIKVDSQPGRGSTFRIHLPVHAQAKTKSLEPQVPALDTDHHKETVLLVEDEPAILDLASTMLARLGYEVIAAASPREAIRSAQSHEGEIHLLLTDVVMPEMNGRDLTKRLVALYPKLKSVFMSGYTADVIAEQGILNEGVCFIAKPFSLPELKAKLREAMDERD